MNHVITPYSGALVNLIDPAQGDALRQEALNLPSLDLDWRHQCEIELLMNGAYSPLTGFMTRAQCRRVKTSRQLDDDTFWPQPVTLASPQPAAKVLQPGDRVALRDGEGFMLAVLTISDAWEENGVRLLGGEIEGVALPLHSDFSGLRVTPADMRALFAHRDWQRVVAWQAHQPMHRAQVEFCLKSAIDHEAKLLLHPIAGGDITEAPKYFGLVRSLITIRDRFPAESTELSLLPAPQHEAGPGELMLRAIVARNYGCCMLIVGGEYQSNGHCRRGDDIRQLSGDWPLTELARKVGVQLIYFPRLVHVEERAEYLPESDLPIGTRILTLGAEDFQYRMQAEQKIPEWYSYPELLAELRRQRPPLDRQGLTVFFTGLSGAGKSTLARALAAHLMETGDRCVTLLDGDIVRRHLSSELGFSKVHRDTNVRRIGYVASAITQNHGIAICAPIAPYRQTRRDVRAMVEAVGRFVEIHVSTPIEICESRDRKGLYAKARAGLLPEFTGISDPYEPPENPDLTIDTTDLEVDAGVERILTKLIHEGLLRRPHQVMQFRGPPN